MPAPRIFVIGAGLGGLTCARQLANGGADVVVLEASGRIGGRLQTMELAGVTLDAGCGHFEILEPPFRRQVTAWQAAGLIDLWDGVGAAGSMFGPIEYPESPRRYIGIDTLDRLCHSLASGLDIRLGHRVSEMTRVHNGWRVNIVGQPAQTCQIVAICLPIAAAAELLTQAPGLRLVADRAGNRPTWKLTMAFAEPLGCPFAGIYGHETPIAWISHESSKAGRPPTPDIWSVQAMPDWARQHVDSPPARVAELLRTAFFPAVEAAPQAVLAEDLRYWPSIGPDKPSGKLALYNSVLAIGGCGDWGGPGGIEGTWLSAQSLATAILDHQRRSTWA